MTLNLCMISIHIARRPRQHKYPWSAMHGPPKKRRHPRLLVSVSRCKERLFPFFRDISLLWRRHDRARAIGRIGWNAAVGDPDVDQRLHGL